MLARITLTFKTVVLLLSMSILFACTSTLNIHSLVDETVQFDGYQTYAFHPNTIRAGNNYDSLSARYIKQAIQNEMHKKGFKLAEDAELWINFNVYVQDKLEVDRAPSISLYYGFRRGYGVWGNYPIIQDRIKQYTEGTLNIDLIDQKTNLLLWEAVAIGRVSSSTYDNLEFKINETVKLMFEQLPSDAR
ncbi:MAG: hypothetical protein ACI9DS_001715 [Glaciecola sp.]|jgi:hypothetical protein